MAVTQIPLFVFRPELFYRWLYRQWHKRNGLGQASRQALSQIHHLFTENEFHVSTSHLLTVVNCAAALTALTEEDFISFVDWALEQPFPAGVDKPAVPIGHDDLAISPARLRQQLAQYYDQERLWPRQGFRSLLSEALSAASQAEEAMHLTTSAVTVPQRQRAVRQTHDGIDRSLLCAEHFLERVIEFAAASAAACKLNAVDDTKLVAWLKQAGIGLTQDKEERRISWDTKQQCLQAIRNAFEAQTPAPESWEHFWPDLLRLLSHFRHGNPSEEGFQLLDELRDRRNAVRHASYTLLEAKTIPSRYKDAIPKIHRAIEELLRSSSRLLPVMVKIVEYRRDFTGAVELVLTTEERRLTVLRYVHEADAASISGLKLSDLPGRLVFASQEQEYFLFPPPANDVHVVVNALLLPSERPKEPVNSITIRQPQIAVPVEFREEAAPVE
ncbi:MAG: hypothetical protein RMN53_11825 [Anaerolineae bacterium]|nr:hypothetical protein [Anaerolineae bacterium]